MIGCQIGVTVAEPARHITRCHPVHRLIGHDSHLGVEQCHVDVGAAAGAVPAVERSEDRHRAVHAREQIGHGDARLLRFAIGFAGHRHHAAHGLGDEIVACAVGVRPGLSEPCDRTGDQARVQCGKRGMVKPVLRQPADLVVLDHDICAACQIANDGLALRAGDVDCERPLAAIGRMEISRSQIGAIFCCHERRPPMPRIVSYAGPFDLDHFGAKVRQQLSAPWASQDAG